MQVTHIQTRLRKEFPDVVLILGCNPRQDHVYLARLSIADPAKRRRGLGTAVLNRLHELCEIAVEVTPSAEFGTPVRVLKRFYTRLGYADVGNGKLRREPWFQKKLI